MGLLEHINTPEDLKQIPRERLTEVAQEIRDLIIKTVSETGGHLASSLGVVELTLALHYVLDSPGDKIIWDVGHQAYAHKLLTGRRDVFGTLRKFGGISGFPRISESEHDAFGTGHSSTSISSALGMAAARDLNGENYRVVAVIGDGSVSSGLALEGLNQAGHIKKDFIVILNDNEWSISQNVGALSSYLNRIMTGRLYTGFRKRLERFLKSIPFTGDMLAKAGRRIEELAKGLIVPGILFEELGFTYIGPLPGHSIDDLIVTLQNAKNFNGPVLIHVITKKGMGYNFAEQNPERFHGVSPFVIESGETRKRQRRRSYTSVFAEEIVKLGETNRDIVAITAAMPGGTGLEKFGERFPDRFFDVGISESHGITFAAGLSTRGKIPVAAIYSTFLQRAYDQIVHDVCLQNLHVVFILDRGGIVGDDGATHQGIFDLSYLRHIPNMTVMAPSDEVELRGMLRFALELGSPVAIRYPRGEILRVPDSVRIPEIAHGKSRTLAGGKDLTIVAIGSSVYPALDAASMLERHGIRADVIDARFAKPIDVEGIESSVRKTGKVVTVEENVLAGGFGSGVIELLADRGHTGLKFVRIGIDDRFVEHGSQEQLRAMLGIDSTGIYEKSMALFKDQEAVRSSTTHSIKAEIGKIL
ncbi:MAG: 1-deoxy-D-xylulose-5-phosphate synthase [Deltaproteobacteria bacterium]|nr:1-deoxy-D-xylulose-5-phosphate synthase [Deltaproteobacteria bacterium]NIS76662.1 1-deoxy-D-xylulose-5-phosphate synthase [Deltaproteobacteria bacterium]